MKMITSLKICKNIIFIMKVLYSFLWRDLRHGNYSLVCRTITTARLLKTKNIRMQPIS